MTHRRGVITTPKIALVFYRTTGGAEPVRDWLKSLDRDDRLAIGGDLQRVQYRWPVGMPLCRAMQGGLGADKPAKQDNGARTDLFS